MKQNIKIFFTALIIGMISAFLICYKFDPTIISNALESKITYFYVGTYNNEDDAINKKNSYENALIYHKNNIYQIIIGIYSNKETMELMESYFLDKNITFYKKELKVSNEFLKDIKNYELLITSSEKSYYEEINKSLLKMFSDYIE